MRIGVFLLSLLLSGCASSWRHFTGEEKFWMVSTEHQADHLYYCKPNDSKDVTFPKPMCVEAEWIDIEPTRATVTAPVGASAEKAAK